jgi:hypothetical protein
MKNNFYVKYGYIHNILMHNLGYFPCSIICFLTIVGYVVVESYLSCIMKQTSFHNCSLFHFILRKHDSSIVINSIILLLPLFMIYFNYVIFPFYETIYIR